MHNRSTSRRQRFRNRALGLVLGSAVDIVLADPKKWHPVAGFGSLASVVERSLYRDSKWAGTLHTVLLVGSVMGVGAGASGFARRRGSVAETLLVASTVWVCLGGTTLVRTGTRMSAHLVDGELDAARALLPSLCGRDPDALDSDGLARASVESIAENTSDAAVGVLVWGALAGVPGIVGYRAVNTLDAMIGYRSERYRQFGWFAARLDDVVNLVPARLTGMSTVALAPTVGGRPGDALKAWRRDASRHPSPNAGVAEATAAGALGVGLGGRTEYAHGVEIRPTLGTGRTPTPSDLQRASALSARVQWSAAAVSALLAVAVGETRIGGRLRRR